MVKKLILIFLAFIMVNPCVFAQETMLPSTGEGPVIDEKNILDQVKILRAKRYAELPYLSKDFINSQIRPEKLQDKNQFVESGPKKLKEVVERAAKVYTPARSARERISLAKRRILVSVRNLFPEARYEYNVKRGHFSGDGYNGNSYKFILKQPIFHGGTLWNLFLQEKLNLETAEKDLEATLEDLAKDVSAAYFEYHRAIQTVDTRKKGIEQLHNLLDISNEKYKSKLISEIEYLNVQSLFSQMQYDYETTKQELELAKLELQKYLDLEVADDVRVSEIYDLQQLLSMKQPEVDEDVKPLSSDGKELLKEEQALEGGKPVPALDSLVDMAYEHRAKLRVEAGKLDAARMNERAKFGALLPQFDITLEMGKMGEAFDSVNQDPNLRKEFRAFLELNWNAAGNKIGYNYSKDERAPSVSQFQGGSGSGSRDNKISVGLLDGLKEWADAKEAEVEKLDQIVALEKAEKEVVHDVKQAYFDYQKARIQMKSALQRANYKRRVSEFSKHRLGKNEIQISEYVQSEIDYLSESISLHKAIADYYTAKAKINHSVGLRDYLPVEELNVQYS